MKHLKILIACLFSTLYFLNVTGQPRQETFILDEPGFPFVFELNPGESQLITRNYKGRTIERIIKLDSIRLFTEPNYWFRKPILQQNYYQAMVDLEISGKAVVLFHRPYQMPVTIDGLRIYIENIKQWDESARYGKCGDMTKQV